MADIKQEINPTEEQQNFAVGTTNDPKNLQELSQYVSSFPHCFFCLYVTHTVLFVNK